jgi:hypothetical protein
MATSSSSSLVTGKTKITVLLNYITYVSSKHDVSELTDSVVQFVLKLPNQSNIIYRLIVLAKHAHDISLDPTSFFENVNSSLCSQNFEGGLELSSSYIGQFSLEKFPNSSTDDLFMAFSLSDVSPLVTSETIDVLLQECLAKKTQNSSKAYTSPNETLFNRYFSYLSSSSRKHILDDSEVELNPRVFVPERTKVFIPNQQQSSYLEPLPYFLSKQTANIMNNISHWSQYKQSFYSTNDILCSYLWGLCLALGSFVKTLIIYLFQAMFIWFTLIFYQCFWVNTRKKRSKKPLKNIRRSENTSFINFASDRTETDIIGIPFIDDLDLMVFTSTEDFLIWLWSTPQGNEALLNTKKSEVSCFLQFFKQQNTHKMYNSFIVERVPIPNILELRYQRSSISIYKMLYSPLIHTNNHTGFFKLKSILRGLFDCLVWCMICMVLYRCIQSFFKVLVGPSWFIIVYWIVNEWLHSRVHSILKDDLYKKISHRLLGDMLAKKKSAVDYVRFVTFWFFPIIQLGTIILSTATFFIDMLHEEKVPYLLHSLVD